MHSDVNPIAIAFLSSATSIRFLPIDRPKDQKTLPKRREDRNARHGDVKRFLGAAGTAGDPHQPPGRRVLQPPSWSPNKRSSGARPPQRD
jgi:hypothetical protein